MAIEKTRSRPSLHSSFPWNSQSPRQKMCLAPPKAAPAAFLDAASGGLRRRGKATLAAARDAAVAVASAHSADAETEFDVVNVNVAAPQQQPAAQQGEGEPSPSLFNDLLCLKTMWFQKQSGSTHEERLSSFYAPQAEACEFFRRSIERDTFDGRRYISAF